MNFSHGEIPSTCLTTRKIPGVRQQLYFLLSSFEFSMYNRTGRLTVSITFPEESTMTLYVTAGFLWLPVSRTSPTVKLHFFSDGTKFQEMDIRLNTEQPEYYAAMDVHRYIGRTIDVRGGLPDDRVAKLFFRDEFPDTDDPFRPRIHFSSPAGWINDPNGLVFADGVWHLYHQWNPFGTEWGNMHWGHAVSRDLITWKHHGLALEPDVFGTVFSGCCWQDCRNDAGFGKNALLFFYTAAGGCSHWSANAGNPFAQRLAVSVDNGKTLQKKKTILTHIKGENRDPKVFYHQESKAYIMILFLDEYDFAVFRSRDLIHWEESQRFSVPEMRECPDLFELPVVNEQNQKKWVFWSADGYYLVGRFDGFRFTPESDVLPAYDTDLPYAAQTYAGVTDRIISVAWLRTENDRGNFRGMMSVPSELSLVRQEGICRMRFRPVTEVWNRFTKSEEYSAESGSLVIHAAGEPLLMKTSWKPCNIKEVSAGGKTLNIRSNSNEILFIMDHGITEYWADDGLRYGAVEVDEKALSGQISLGTGICKAEVYRFHK